MSAVGANLTYYWQLNGVPLTDGGSVSGSSTATLVISPAFANYNGTYTVTASNSFGSLPATNSATLTVIDPDHYRATGGFNELAQRQPDAFGHGDWRADVGLSMAFQRVGGVGG